MKRRLTKTDVVLLLTVLVGLVGVAGVSRLIDSQRPVASASLTVNQLYLKGATVK